MENKWTYWKERDLFCKCEIVIMYNKSKLTIQIQIKSGIVTVQGQNYKEWLELHFQRIKDQLEITFGENNAIMDGESVYKESENLQNVLSPKRTQEVIPKESDLLWEKNDELVNVISSQDSVIQMIIERCQDIELKVNNLNSELCAEKIEKSLDVRMTSLIEVIYGDMEKKVSEIKSYVSTKLHEMNNKMEKAYQQLQSTL